MDTQELEAIATRTIDAVKREAKDAGVQVTLQSSRSSNLRFARGTMTSCGDSAEETLSLRVILGMRHADVSSNQTDDASLAAIARRAVQMARIVPEDPESMPLLPPQSYAAAVNSWDPAIGDLSADTRASTARIAMGLATQAGLHEAGYFEGNADTILLANSAGLRASNRGTYAEFSLTARTRDETGSGWAFRASHKASEIDVSAVTRAACDKATRSANARALVPGRYTVVLEPAAVGELLGFLGESLDARSVDEGRSAFTKPGGGSRLGDAIASPLITLRSDPSDPDLPVDPFDPDSGLPRKPITWIDRGVLRALDYSRYWAAKVGKEPTTSGGWHLGGGEAASIDALVSGVKRGLLVTRFWYSRVLDPQLALATGLTRDGVFLIEDGHITAPVRNFRWNESPLHMLNRCDGLTKETWRVNSWARVPALRTQEFNMDSASDAV